MLIVLDEFDRAENIEFRRDLAELIKILSDRSVRVQLVIAGVAADLAELVEHIPSVRRNILAIPVPLMSAEEIGELVTNGERTSGITVTPAARDHIVAISAGSPYIASLLCHHAALDAIDDQRLDVVPSDVASALEQAQSELGTRISKNTMGQVHRLVSDSGTDLLSLIASASLAGGGEFDLAANWPRSRSSSWSAMTGLGNATPSSRRPCRPTCGSSPRSRPSATKTWRPSA